MIKLKGIEQNTATVLIALIVVICALVFIVWKWEDIKVIILAAIILGGSFYFGKKGIKIKGK